MSNVIKFVPLGENSDILEIYQATLFNLLVLQNEEQDRGKLGKVVHILELFGEYFPDVQEVQHNG